MAKDAYDLNERQPDLNSGCDSVRACVRACMRAPCRRGVWDVCVRVRACVDITPHSGIGGHLSIYLSTVTKYRTN